MPFLELENIEKSFGDSSVLNRISLELEEHQTLAVLGRSGCGKTTLLKIIAGLLDSNGRIMLDGRAMNGLLPQQRGIVYLYQESLLFPHLNVFENVAFGLRLRKLPETDIRHRVSALLEALGLSDQGLKMPTALSGGQKQRVAFGRALIIQPKLLLLDEPFGALDVETRSAMQSLFKKIASEVGITTLFVTHDLKEAVLMGDRLGYMEHGQLEIFDSLAAFIADERTGMRQEIEFWQKL